VFDKVKGNVSAYQAAQKYGLQINRHGLACCPFHADKTPSLKVDTRFYCFGCHVTGDAVDLTAKLLNVPLKKAAEQIVQDFGLESKGIKHTPNAAEKWQGIREIRDRIKVYIGLLEKQKERHAPGDRDSEWETDFVEALKRIAYAELLLDFSYDYQSAGSFMADYEKEMNQIGYYLERNE